MGARLPQPVSAQELCDSVRDGVRYDASRLDRVLRVDALRPLVEVQANTTWKSLAASLRPDDAQLRELRTTCPTIGASLARNAAGPDGRPTVVHVESLTLVGAEGRLRRIDRITNAPLFALVVGGHGVFGALYSVTLRVESLARAIAEAQSVAPSEDEHTTRALQLLVPPHEASAFVAKAREICAQWHVVLEKLAVRQIRHEDETFLRWATRDYAEVSLVLAEKPTLGQRVRATQLRRELIDAAIAHDGSFPIACTPEATRKQTEACYPQLEAFLLEQRRLDPIGRWANAWSRHQRRVLGGAGCSVRWN